MHVYIVAHMAMAITSNCRMICEISRGSLSLRGGHCFWRLQVPRACHTLIKTTPPVHGFAYVSEGVRFFIYTSFNARSIIRPKTLALNWTRVQSVLDVKVRIHCRPPRFTSTRFSVFKHHTAKKKQPAETSFRFGIRPTTNRV